ncbi:polyprotein [Black grass varicosavirus-like virus]|uniref:Replicase n=1 Tax=Black grass varicosavirus-like virus TaxID=1587515 RepID=A0A0D6DUM0_9RHAB|nr:polyprotein [Black grass varicosavirus-like virus]CEK42597.1 polyprotein [Black grass varicosavirus-like virus]
MDTLEHAEANELEDDDYFLPDEGPLHDMHLASAINLDQIQELMYPGTIKYKIDIPYYLRDEYMLIESLCKGDKIKMELGMLAPSLKLSKPGGELSTMDLPAYKEIGNLVCQALRNRDIMIPISMNDVALKLPGVIVYRSWGIAFAELLKIICTRAEVMRGGSQPVYQGTGIEAGAAHCQFQVNGNWYQIVARKNLSTLYDRQENVMYIGNIHSLLLLMDTIGQRICLMVANQIAELYDTPGWVDQGKIDQILSTGDDILEEMGNDGYETIAMFESLVIGKVLRATPDDITECHKFLYNCMDEVENMLLNSAMRGRIIELVHRWLAIFDSLSIKELSNVFCLYRCWGHPVVNIYEGMEKVYDIGTEEKEVSPWVATDILCQFRKTFLINYYEKHHYYPNVLISEEVENSYVAQCIKKGSSIEEMYPTYDTKDFLGIEIQKIWDIPITFDLCHILNDKAVSPNQKELTDSVVRYQNTTGGQNRRGLLRWLRGKSLNCREFLREIDQNGLPEDECIIGMYEKEREIKIKARMFSLMSERMRYYFVLTEDLIAKHVLELFPAITMKDSQNVLQKKFWTVGGMGKDSTFDVNINIDFSKWNSNMRNELTQPMFQQLDKIFGYTNLISRTHEIFESSFVYSSSGKYVPTVKFGKLQEDPPMAYRGHKGGFEGLRQKGWTVATVCALSAIAERRNVRTKLMGQGDNQIVRILMPTQRWKSNELTIKEMIQNAKQIQKAFVTDMERTFEEAKLPIKVRETWASTRLFMYGKMILHDGDAMPQWFKKVLRSYALTNEGQVTVAGVVGTIATNMASAAGLSEMPDVMYLIFVAMTEWSLGYLLEYHPFTRKCILREHEYHVKIPGAHRGRDYRVRSVNKRRLVVSMILIPTAAGGSVTVPLPGFIMRGFPDHASEAYAWIKMLAEVKSPYKTMLKNWYTFIGNDSIQPDMLIQSPSSINFLKPPTPSFQGRMNVRELLLSGEFDQNQFIKEAGTILGVFDRKKVCSAMLTDPMNPFITSEVYSTYAHVYIDGVIKRVENTSTIKKLAQKVKTKTQVIKAMMYNEHNFIMFISWRAMKRGTIDYDCATQQARMARNIGWGRTITGVTTPHPVELGIGHICKGRQDECPPTDYIYVRINEKGEFVPYLGSRIKCKVVSEQDIDARREPLIAVGSRICRYSSWLGIGPNLMEIVEKNLAVVCDTSVYDKFIDDDPKGLLSSGSIDHRFTPAGASEGVFINYAPQIGCNVYMSSDCMPTYGRGQTNYTLHFQALYCWLQYISSRRAESVFMHHHIECEDCVVPTTDEVPDIQCPFPYFDNIYPPRVRDSISRALGFIDRKGGLDIMSNVRSLCHEAEPGMFDVRQLQKGVMWTLAIKIGFRLYHGGLFGSDDTRVEDLQEYPRIYSYKLYRDTLLVNVAHVMMMLAAIEMDKAPDGEELAKVRRRATDKLLSKPIGSFKGLGGLTLGRTDENPDNSHLFMTGSFPETVFSILNTSKTALIETIGQIGRLSIEGMGHLPVAKGSLSNKQFRFLIMMRCLLECRNSHYFQHFQKIPEDEPGHPADPQNDVYRMLVKTPVLDMSLDKMVKSLAVINERKTLPIIEWNNISFESTEVICRTGTPRSIFIGNRMIVEQNSRREYREVTLPTSSIYKWAGILFHKPLKRHIIVLGDGTGGTSLLVKTFNQDSTVYPCSYLETHKIIPQDMECLMPQLSRGYEGISGRVLLNVPDDIKDPLWSERMSSEINDMGVERTSIVCDIETVGLCVLLDAFRSLPQGVQVVMKTYAKDILTNIMSIMGLNQVEVGFSPHLNQSNHEVFLMGHISQNSFPDPDMMINQMVKLYGKVRADPRSRILEEMRMINKVFKPLKNTSVSLSLAHINNLGITMTREILQLDGLEIWGYALQFVNRHYVDPSHRAFLADKKTMNRKRKRDLTRAFRILLGVVVNPGYLDIKRKWGIRTPKEFKPRGMNLILARDCDDMGVKLTKKDKLASECLHCFWTRKMRKAPLDAPDPPGEDWMESATRVRSFASSLSEHSSHDYINVIETE